MRRRCPSHRFISIAKLEDHKLAFTRRSSRRRCGVADVLPALGEEVWGILYYLKTKRDLRALDKAEGYEAGRQRVNGYDRETREVWSPLFPHKRLVTHIYLARQQDNPPPPNDHYLGLMSKGAEHWGLPRDYKDKITKFRSDLGLSTN